MCQLLYTCMCMYIFQDHRIDLFQSDSESLMCGWRRNMLCFYCLFSCICIANEQGSSSRVMHYKKKRRNCCLYFLFKNIPKGILFVVILLTAGECNANRKKKHFTNGQNVFYRYKNILNKEPVIFGRFHCSKSVNLRSTNIDQMAIRSFFRMCLYSGKKMS